MKASRQAADMEDQLLKRRISPPRAVTVVALAAVLAAAVAVTPSLAKTAQSFLTSKKAASTYVSNKKAATLYLKQKAAANQYVAKATAPKPPVVSVAASNTVFGPVSATTAGYIPTAFTSFATPAKVSTAVITFSGTATCTASGTVTTEEACPVSILVDGQTAGKYNFAPATASTGKPAPLVHTILQTSVLGKGGHTVAIEYAGAKNVTFTLNSWNLAVQAYPQAEEAPTTTPTGAGSGGGK
jgi:hypothetical protein